MLHNDKQIGRPQILYKDLLESLPELLIEDEGALAYATDQDSIYTWNGTEWQQTTASGTGGEVDHLISPDETKTIVQTDDSGNTDFIGNITVSGTVDSVNISEHDHSGANQGGTIDIEDTATTENNAYKVLQPNGAGGVAWSIYSVEDAATAETDTSKRLAPDGAGGVTWGVGGTTGDIETLDTSENNAARYLRPDGAGGLVWAYLDHLVASDGSPNPALQVDVAGNIGVGISSPTGKFHIKGTADDQQLIIQGYSTQNFNLTEWKNSSGNLLAYITKLGEAYFSDYVYILGNNEPHLRIKDTANATTEAIAYLQGLDKNSSVLWKIGNKNTTTNDFIISTSYNGDIRLEPNNTGYVTATKDIRAQAGISVGSESLDPSTGDILYTGNLRPRRGSTTYTGYIYVPLSTYKSVWYGGSKSANTYPYTITSSYGVPTGAKAIVARMSGQWSSAGNGVYMAVKMYGASEYDLVCRSSAANISSDICGICRLDSSNRIQIKMSATCSNGYFIILGYFI